MCFSIWLQQAFQVYQMNSKQEPAHTRTDLAEKWKQINEKLTINIRGCITLLYLNVLRNFLTDFYFFVQLKRKQEPTKVCDCQRIHSVSALSMDYLLSFHCGQKNWAVVITYPISNMCVCVWDALAVSQRFTSRTQLKRRKQCFTTVTTKSKDTSVSLSQYHFECTRNRIFTPVFIYDR